MCTDAKFHENFRQLKFSTHKISFEIQEHLIFCEFSRSSMPVLFVKNQSVLDLSLSLSLSLSLCGELNYLEVVEE